MFEVCTAATNEEIVFIVDASSKTVGGSTSWSSILSFISQIIANFNYVGQSYVRFSLVIYNDQLQQTAVVFNINSYQSVSDYQRAVQSATYLQGGSNLANGINLAVQNVLTSSNLRIGAWWVVVIITDNLPSSANNQQLQSALANLRRYADYVYAIGFNPANLVDNGLLNTVSQSSISGQTLVDLYPSYSYLTASYAQQAAQRICFAGNANSG